MTETKQKDDNQEPYNALQHKTNGITNNAEC